MDDQFVLSNISNIFDFKLIDYFFALFYAVNDSLNCSAGFSCFVSTETCSIEGNQAKMICIVNFMICFDLGLLKL